MERDTVPFTVYNGSSTTAAFDTLSPKEKRRIVQGAIYAAFGYVKLDYRSPKRLDEAAGIVADFVCSAMAGTK